MVTSITWNGAILTKLVLFTVQKSSIFKASDMEAYFAIYKRTSMTNQVCLTTSKKQREKTVVKVVITV